jgi:DNA-binding NarL/FixJ family response regulator
MTKPRVLVADDHQVVAEGLRSLLAPHFDVVGVVSDGRQLLASAKALDPDVVVLDISMPSLNGIDAARQLRSANSRAKLVFLTMHREAVYAARALEAGGSGFVLKHSAPSELVTAIREALRGGTYVTPQITGELLASYRGGTPVGAAEGDLTPRQREVLQLTAEGRSAKEIAAILHISRRTAEFHKARLMETLGVQNTAELIQYAIRTGISGCQPPAATLVNDAGARSAVREFYEGLLQHDWSRAYALLHPDSRRGWTVDQFTQSAEAYRRHLGFEPETVRIRACEGNGSQAVAHVVLTGRAEAKRQYKDMLFLRLDGGAWTVVLPRQFGRN